LKTVVVRRVEGASLRAVLFLRIVWWFVMYHEPYTDVLVFFTTDDGQHFGRNAIGL
jgi:hypothetical protein